MERKGENSGEEVKFQDQGGTNCWNWVEQIILFVVNSGSNWPCASPKIRTLKYLWHSGGWLGKGEHCYLFKMHFWTCPFGQIFSAPPKITICSSMHKFILTIYLEDEEVGWSPFYRLGSLNDLFSHYGKSQQKQRGAMGLQCSSLAQRRNLTTLKELLKC